MTPFCGYHAFDLIYYSMATLLSLGNIAVTVAASKKINKWKEDELTHLGYKWSWKKEGLFTIYFINETILLTTLQVAAILTFTKYDKYTMMCVILIFFTVLSSLASLFILAFLTKMSFAKWTDLP